MNISPPERKYSLDPNLSSETGKVGLFHKPGVILVFFDTETTGVDKVKNPETGRWVQKTDPLTGRVVQDEPTEVSAQKYMIEADNSLSFIDEMEIYVKPSIPVPENVEEITGITNEFLADKPSWHDVHAQIRGFFQDNIVIAHNAPFDVKFMSRMYEREGDLFKPNGVIDTLAISRYLYPGAKSRKLGSMIELLQLQHKVDYLCNGDLKYHNATYDVVALRVLYEALLEKIPSALHEKRTCPYIEVAYFWKGYNHYAPATVFKTSCGKIEYNHNLKKWMSDDVDLYHVDMGKFEKLALDYTHSADIEDMKKNFGKIKPGVKEVV